MISNFRVCGDESGISKPESGDSKTGGKQVSVAPKTISTSRDAGKNKSKRPNYLLFSVYFANEIVRYEGI